MSLFKRLLGSKPSAADPTAGWPPAAGKPGIDLEGKVGPMKLGDPVEAARGIGRPEQADVDAEGGNLEYDGFHLEFLDGRLVCAAFNLESSDRVDVGDFTLTRATTALDVQVWFGDASSDGREGNLRWIDFERPGVTLALEFEDEKLAYVQLYSEGYA